MSLAGSMRCIVLFAARDGIRSSMSTETEIRRIEPPWRAESVVEQEGQLDST